MTRDEAISVIADTFLIDMLAATDPEIGAPAFVELGEHSRAVSGATYDEMAHAMAEDAVNALLAAGLQLEPQ